MPAPRFHDMSALEEPHTTVAATTLHHHHHRQRRVCCFSFAAYAKAVVDQLRASGVPLDEGLSDAEFSAIEGSYGLEFPSDLRAILREGLPLGAGFPNWRSSSPEQLRGLLRLPASAILIEVSRGSFWCQAAWGPRPEGLAEAVSVAKGVMDAAPPLVPIYGHFYMPSRPNLPGNPVFFVRGGEVRCSGYDLTDFFLRVKFKGGGGSPAPCHDPATAEELLPVVPAPAWAATSARRIDVWTHLVEGGSSPPGRPLQKLLNELECMLREGGWAEGEVREMLTAAEDARPADRAALLDRHSVARHVRLLAESLLRAGWSREDVVYSMGVGRSAGGQLEAVTWLGGRGSKQMMCPVSIEQP